MLRFRRKNSSNIAKERLKLVLIHDRAGTSPSNNILEMLRREIITVISKYFEVDEEDFDVDIKNSTDVRSNYAETRLTANIPIRSVKNIGRNRQQ
ncbi:MAG: cell division topological specificity factor MinE [Christensenellales bacterium]|jgi:cell division topological specificity factor